MLLCRNLTQQLNLSYGNIERHLQERNPRLSNTREQRVSCRNDQRFGTETVLVESYSEENQETLCV
jgi:hypothetical protein